MECCGNAARRRASKGTHGGAGVDNGRLRRGKLVETVVGHVPNLLNRLTCVLCSYLAVHLEGQLLPYAKTKSAFLRKVASNFCEISTRILRKIVFILLYVIQYHSHA